LERAPLLIHLERAERRADIVHPNGAAGAGRLARAGLFLTDDRFDAQDARIARLTSGSRSGWRTTSKG